MFDTSNGKHIGKLTVTGNTVITTNNTGISVLPSFTSTFSEVSVVGNVINITMDGTADKGIQATSPRAVIAQNTINATGSAAGDGIWVSGGGATVQGNNVDMGGVGSRGILNFSNYVTITGNYVKGTTSYGIRNDAATNFVAVVGNVLESCVLGVLNGGANSITASNV